MILQKYSFFFVVFFYFLGQKPVKTYSVSAKYVPQQLCYLTNGLKSVHLATPPL